MVSEIVSFYEVNRVGYARDPIVLLNAFYHKK